MRISNPITNHSFKSCQVWKLCKWKVIQATFLTQVWLSCTSKGLHWNVFIGGFPISLLLLSRKACVDGWAQTESQCRKIRPQFSFKLLFPKCSIVPQHVINKCQQKDSSFFPCLRSIVAREFWDFDFSNAWKTNCLVEHERRSELYETILRCPSAVLFSFPGDWFIPPLEWAGTPRSFQSRAVLPFHLKRPLKLLVWSDVLSHHPDTRSKVHHSEKLQLLVQKNPPSASHDTERKRDDDSDASTDGPMAAEEVGKESTRELRWILSNETIL